MSYFLKKFDKWAEDEDEQLMKCFEENYGPMLRITSLFPSWKRSQLDKTFGFIACYAFALGFHFYVLSTSILKLQDNFTLASLAFHFWLLFFFAMVSMVLMNASRGQLSRAHRLMAQDLGQYKAGRIYDEDKPQKLQKERRKQFLQFLFLPGMVVMIATAVLVVPYIKKLSQETGDGDAHYTETGVNLNLPIACYYPFPTHTGILHGVTVLGQAIAAGTLASVVVVLEVMLFLLSNKIIFELKVLHYGVESVFERAKTLHAQLHPEQKRVKTRSDFRFQRCVEQCLKDCIIHHYQIKQLIKEFEMTLKWPVAMAYTIGTGVIGLSLVNILNAQKNEDVENMALFFLLLTLEVLNMYIISLFGENITTESEVLRDVLYIIDWEKLDLKNRKILLNFQTGITNPIIVKAGGLIALCMDTFSSIMNTAYSFFNLMNAS